MGRVGQVEDVREEPQIEAQAAGLRKRQMEVRASRKGGFSEVAISFSSGNGFTLRGRWAGKMIEDLGLVVEE